MGRGYGRVPTALKENFQEQQDNKTSTTRERNIKNKPEKKKGWWRRVKKALEFCFFGFPDLNHNNELMVHSQFCPFGSDICW